MDKFLKGQHSLGYEPKQAFEFHAAAGYTPKQGDHVKLTATAGEVTLAGDGEYVHGIVDVVYTPLQLIQRLTVDLKGQRCEPATAKAAFAAGDLLVAAGANKFRKFVTGTDKPENVVGFALTGAAVDGERFEIVYR